MSGGKRNCLRISGWLFILTPPNHASLVHFLFFPKPDPLSDYLGAFIRSFGTIPIVSLANEWLAAKASHEDM